MSKKDITIAEIKIEKWHSQGGICPVCGKPVTCYDDLSHKIPQRRWCLRKYGTRIIHHADNLVLTHPQCNSAVSLGNHPVECERLAKSIADKMLRLE